MHRGFGSLLVFTRPCKLTFFLFASNAHWIAALLHSQREAAAANARQQRMQVALNTGHGALTQVLERCDVRDVPNSAEVSFA